MCSTPLLQYIMFGEAFHFSPLLFLNPGKTDSTTGLWVQQTQSSKRKPQTQQSKVSTIIEQSDTFASQWFLVRNHAFQKGARAVGSSRTTTTRTLCSSPPVSQEFSGGLTGQLCLCNRGNRCSGSKNRHPWVAQSSIPASYHSNKGKKNQKCKSIQMVSLPRLAGTVQMAMNRQLQILTKFQLNLVGPEVHLLLNKSRFAIGSPARTKASSQDTKILGESMQKLNPDMKRQGKKSQDMEVEEVHLSEPLAGRLVLLIASRARKQGWDRQHLWREWRVILICRAVDEKGPCGAIPTLGFALHVGFVESWKGFQIKILLLLVRWDDNWWRDLLNKEADQSIRLSLQYSRFEEVKQNLRTWTQRSTSWIPTVQRQRRSPRRW